MKNFIKTFSMTVVIITALSLSCKGQTPVSGGIYTNTTWTLANSPYIVIDTVVVFPGVKLTIQSGVVVKFHDNTRLEIRQGTLVANGSSIDSITFTSNSTPIQLNWNIYLNNDSSSTFNYCNFSYSNQFTLSGADNSALIIKNSNFYSNYGGAYIYNAPAALVDSCVFKLDTFALYTYGGCVVNSCIISNNINGITIGYCTLQNSLIDSNSIGVYANLNSTVINCMITNNNIGLKNAAGVGNVTVTKNIIENNYYGFWLNDPVNNIYCNKICNNTSYDFYYNVTQSSNISIPNNYWCTTDSATIETKIYDGYDNINLGLVNFIPFDTLQCYLTTGALVNTIIAFQFSIFPNPAFDNLTVTLPTNFLKSEIKIFNILGELEYFSTTTNQRTNINILNMTKGVHIIQITTNNNISKQKFIKQ